MSDYVGKQLGNYRLIRLLGKGGFAEVYLGEHISFRTSVAIKIYSDSIYDEEQELHHEASILARLKHPNIIRFLDFAEKDGKPFLVMDYAPNGTLKERHAREKQVPLAPIISYVKQIVPALQYMHDQRVVHRNIKPGAMLLGSNNEIQLGSFGIADTWLNANGKRRAGYVAGTPPYMAPEQFRGDAQPSSDQYALATMVYEWLSGELPFTAPSSIKLVSLKMRFLDTLVLVAKSKMMLTLSLNASDIKHENRFRHQYLK